MDWDEILSDISSSDRRLTVSEAVELYTNAPIHSLEAAHRKRVSMNGIRK